MWGDKQSLINLISKGREGKVKELRLTFVGAEHFTYTQFLIKSACEDKQENKRDKGQTELCTENDRRNKLKDEIREKKKVC